MVLNFIMGGAAINVFCRQHSLGLVVVDAGVNFDFEPALTDGRMAGRFMSRKIAKGTRNYLEEEAMSAEEVIRAVEAGKEVVDELFEKGCNCIGFGEMGIGNTSSASLIMQLYHGCPGGRMCRKGNGGE